MYLAGRSPEEIADFFHSRPCVRTVRDWLCRYNRDPARRVPTPKPRLGLTLSLSQEHSYSLWVLKNACPTLSHEAARHFLAIVSDKTVSASTVSREVVQRLGMTRKKMSRVSSNRDEEERVQFITNGPLDSVRPGIFGVPATSVVSFDEKTLKYADCLKMFGHSVRGVPCRRRGPAPSSQLSYNVIRAVDIRVGCVAYLIYRGTLDRDTFYCWAALQVS